MESVVAKRRGKLRRKRRLKKLHERIKREVRSTWHRHRMDFPECNITGARETLATGTMQADAFWKNYTVAQEWQRRHSVTWWRSRCVALEHENKLLRDKVRLLAQHRGQHPDTREDNYHAENNGDNNDDDTRDENHEELGTDNEDLEFNVTEDLLNFFETSERHKQEMRRKYGFNRVTREEENSEEVPFVGAAEKERMRKKEADLLYGGAGSKILAMETTLQSTVEQYEYSVNPQYWPNIPLKT